MDATNGETRNVLDEKTKTFIWSAHTEAIGVRLINYLRNEDEILYISEMDGWRHFYLIDVPTGNLKQITKGQWIVRGVNRIDEDARQIWFTASGVYPDQDPYFVHYGRVNFDGTGLTWLASGNGNHTINFGGEGIPARCSRQRNGRRCHKQFFPAWKVRDRQVQPRRYAAGHRTAPRIRRANRLCAGKGRVDGAVGGAGSFRGQRARRQDGYLGADFPAAEFRSDEEVPGHRGYLCRAAGFIRAEDVQPRSDRYQELNNLGFIVVKIDGMGTANRSKAFHDVCWQNLKDGGFLDRIAWIKDAAKKYPYMDIDRVGIFGTSAGGQNAAARRAVPSGVLQSGRGQ